jgi:hypothetical protein
MTHDRRAGSAARGLVLVASLIAVLAGAAPALAQDAGHIKVIKGSVRLQRAAQAMAATVGMKVQQGDVLTTGGDGSVGITFLDSSLLSAGPNSVLSIDRFAFDTTTHTGALETTLRSGTLAAVSGKIAKQSPGAMKVRTPSAVLGVRGTEFAARTEPTR